MIAAPYEIIVSFRLFASLQRLQSGASAQPDI